MKISNELKTGAVIFAAIAVLVTILFKTGDLDVGKKGYTVTANLGYVAGVKKFAPVRLAGVEVGEVRELKLLYGAGSTSVECALWVRDDVRLRRDSIAAVATLGLMGEKYIEVKPGVSPEFIEPGGTVNSREPVSLEDLFEDFRKIAADVKLTLGDFRNLVNNASGVLDENKPKIGRILDNLESTTEYFNEFAEDVRYNPWKVLAKSKEKTPEELEKLRAERKARKLGLPPPEEAALEAGRAAPAKSVGANFATRRK